MFSIPIRSRFFNLTTSPPATNVVEDIVTVHSLTINRSMKKGGLLFMDWECALIPHLCERKLDLYINDRPLEKPLLDCSLGTNPLGAPPSVMSLMTEGKTAWDLASYPTDLTGFIHSIAEFWQGKVATEEVLPGAGTMEIIFNLVRLFGRPGNVILGVCPQFPDVPQRFRLTGTVFRTVQLQGPEYRLKTTPFINALAGDVCLAYLDHPHNPTGQAWDLADLARIARRCEEVGALLVVDEAYGASLPQEKSAIMLQSPSVIVLRSFSKVWGLAGLRAGYAVSRCPEFRNFYRKASLPVALSAPALRLVPIAIRERNHLERTRKTFRTVKQIILSVVQETPGVTLAATHPTTPIFYVQPADTGEDLFKRLLTVGMLSERGNCYEGIPPGGTRIRVPAPDDIGLFLNLWRKTFHL